MRKNYLIFVIVVVLLLGVGAVVFFSKNIFEKWPLFNSLHHVVTTDPTKPIVVDFATVVYFPNLKTKIGFSSNAKDSILTAAVPKVDAIGPGLLCSNIEFDLWYKHPDEAMDNAALVQQADDSGRPKTTSSDPSDWLVGYEKMLGDRNVQQLLQITGAPAQFQSQRFVDTGKNVSVHPAPTDVVASAAFMGQWTASQKHSYPILWSFWNEPGHTFMGILRTRNEYGEVVLPNEKSEEFDVRESQMRTTSSIAFAKLFIQNELQIRSHTHPYAQVGLASFLSADFNPYKLTSSNDVYFKAVTDAIQTYAPNTTFDFITFNNFNGGWPVSISGARAVLGTHINVPFIVTQYSPSSLKVSENDDIVSQTATPMSVSVEMLSDIAQLEKASDVKAMCMSYWVGGKYGFLTETDDGALIENPRYQTIALFAQLPTVRTALTFGSSGLQELGIHGLAGKNQSKVSVLLWNQGTQTVAVPLSLTNVPDAFKTAKPEVTLQSDAGLQKDSSLFKNNTITLPPSSVALIELRSDAVPDPLLRRNPIVSDGSVATRFLQTKVSTHRQSALCTKVTTLPNVPTCSQNTGTYGFYDSVRGIAYMGRGADQADAAVFATYENLPTKLYVHTSLFASYTSGIRVDALPMTTTVTFPSCGKTVTAVDTQEGYSIFDFAAKLVPEHCRLGQAATITFTLSGKALAGTQAEVYVSSSYDDIVSLSKLNSILQLQAASVDTQEGLLVDPFFKPDTGVTKEIIESMRITALASCEKNNTNCPPYLKTPLSLIDKQGTLITTFQPKDGGTVVKAARGSYDVETQNGKRCSPLQGTVETSKGVINEVTVLCPVQ